MGRRIRRHEGPPLYPEAPFAPFAPEPTEPVIYVKLDNGEIVPAARLDNGQYITEGHSIVSHFTSASVTVASVATAFSSSASPTTSILPTEPNIPYPSPSPNTNSSLTNPFDNSANSSSEDQFWDAFSSGAKAGIVIAIIFGFFSVIVASIWFCCGRPRRRREKERESKRLDFEREQAMQRSGEMAPGASVEALGVPVPLSTMSTRSREREERRLAGGVNSGLPEGNVMAELNGRPASQRFSLNGTQGAASRLSRHMSLRGGGIDAPPPRYEEVAPPAHQTLAGGRRYVNNQPMGGYNANGRGFVEDDEGAGVIADGKMPISEMPLEDVVLEQTRSEGSNARDFEDSHARGGGDTRGHTNS